MKNRMTASGLLMLGVFAGSALGSVPQMGGGMSHLLVTLHQNQIYLTFESPNMSTVELQDHSESYGGAASVLNNTGYNSQFGWVTNGFISLPSAAGIYVHRTNSSPYLDVFSESGFDPILGTDGSSDVWQWDGTMTHNWYSTRVRGHHAVEYEVFVGDQFGNPLDGYLSGAIELNFQYHAPRHRIHGVGESRIWTSSPVPTPGTAAVIGVLVSVGHRRRR